MINRYKPPAASWRFLLVFLVALGLVPGVPGFEHVRDALLYPFGPSEDTRRSDPDTWPVTADLVAAAVAPPPARYLSRLVRYRIFDIDSHALIIRAFSIALLPGLRGGAVLAAVPRVLQILGFRSQRSLRGPPR